MALPSAADLELPIKNPPISGPAVDSLVQRKEKNDNDAFTAETMATNFSDLRASVMVSLKRITSIAFKAR